MHSEASANLAEKTKALRELLRKNNAWLCGTPQRVAFEVVKKALTTYGSCSCIDKQQKQRQERTFNTRRRARELSELVPGDNVWVPDQSSEATVLDEVNRRSYEVEMSE